MRSRTRELGNIGSIVNRAAGEGARGYVISGGANDGPGEGAGAYQS